MCDPVTVGTLMAISTVMTGYGQYQQGKFEQGVSEYNARQLDNEATRTRNKGVEEENKQRRHTAELISQQRASAAAGGVDINSGSALQLQADSELLGEVDALTIRSNFTDQASSLNDQAGLTKAKGKNAAKRGRNALGSSLLTAGSQFGKGVQ